MDLLDARTVADRLQVNKRTVLRMVQRRELPAVKVGRQWRFHSDDLDAYLVQRQRRAAFQISEPAGSEEGEIRRKRRAYRRVFSVAQAHSASLNGHGDVSAPDGPGTIVQTPGGSGERATEEPIIPLEPVSLLDDWLQTPRPTVLPPSDEVVLLPPRYFVGRAQELAWLEDCLRSESVTAVSGMGGIGKTTLAAIAVRSVRRTGHFPDGVAVVFCQGQTEPTEVIRRVLARFHPKRRPPHEDDFASLAEVARWLLGGKQALVVLDGIEPELDIERAIAPLREAGAALLLIAQQHLPRTIVPAVANKEVERLLLSEAMELFARSSGRDEIIDPTCADHPAAAAIVATLGCHPLAVKIAGGYAADLKRPLNALAEQLQDRRHVLKLSEGGGPRSVEHVFAAGLKALPREAQRLFAALAVFPTGQFGRGAVLALGKALGIPRAESHLDALILRSFADSLTNSDLPSAADQERVGIHPLLHAYAAVTFERWSPEKRRAARAALATYYASYASQASEAALEIDEANITGMLEWAHVSQQDELVAALGVGIAPFWVTRKRPAASTYLPWCMQAALATYKKAAKDSQIGRRVLRLYLAYGQVYLREGNLNAAEKILLASQRHSCQLRDQHTEGVILGSLGYVAERRGAFDKAEDYLRQGLAALRALEDRQMEDRQNERFILNRLGQIARQRGKLPDAEEYFRQALEAAYETEKDKDVILSFLGRVARQRGDMKTAEIYLQQALRLAEQTRDLWGQGIILPQLGQLAHERGNLKEAERCYQKSLDIFREVRDEFSESFVWNDLGRLARQRGELEHAERLFLRAQEIACRVHNRRGEGIVLRNLGYIAQRRGHPDQAKQSLEQALEIAVQLGQRRDEGEARCSLGQLAHQVGHLELADRWYRESLQIFTDVQDLQSQGIVLLYLGRLAQRRGQLDKAAMHFGEALDIACKVQDRQHEGLIYYNLGRLARHRGYLSEAEGCFQKALMIAREVQDMRSEGLALSSLGQVAHESGRLRVAEPYYRRGLVILKKVQERMGETIVLNNLGRIELQWGHLDEAEHRFGEALKIAVETKHQRARAMTLCNVARLAERRGQLGAAQAHLEEALTITLQVQDRRGEGISLGYRGRISFRLGRLDEAKDYLQRALAVARAVGDRRGECVHLNDLAKVARQRGDFAEAERCARTALHMAQEIEDHLAQGTVLTTLGCLAWEQGQGEKAEQHLDQALARARLLEDLRDVGEICYHQARMAETNGDFVRAESLYRESLALFDDTQSGFDRAAAQLALGRLLIEKREKPDEGQRLLGSAAQWQAAIGIP